MIYHMSDVVMQPREMFGLHGVRCPEHCVCNETHYTGDPICGAVYTSWPVQPPVIHRQPEHVHVEYRTYRRTNHARHIFWGALTGGLWLVTGYPICVLLNRCSRYITRETAPKG
jgi:hypothetical protein